MLRRALGERIEIETTVSGGLWNTFADPGQIENALLNLAINARDAMENSGNGTTKGLGAQKIHPSLVIFGSFGLLKGTTLSPASPSASTMHFANCLAASGPIACGSSF